MKKYVVFSIVIAIFSVVFVGCKKHDYFEPNNGYRDTGHDTGYDTGGGTTAGSIFPAKILVKPDPDPPDPWNPTVSFDSSGDGFTNGKAVCSGYVYQDIINLLKTYDYVDVDIECDCCGDYRVSGIVGGKNF